MICRPFRIPSWASSQGEPRPVAQHCVQAAAGNLQSSPIDTPGCVRFGAHRLPDAVFQICRQRHVHGFGKRQAENLGIRAGVVKPRTLRRFAFAEPGQRAHGAQAVRDAIADSIETLPEQLRRSLTWDQGTEMAQHAQLRINTGLAIYFCDPHSPWQRGTNENTNGLLRQYFPKGISLRQFGPEDLREVAAQLNGRPRKTLGWKSPAHAMNQLLS